MRAGADNATVLDELVVALRQAAEFNSADQAPPVVVVWPDPTAEWAALLPELRLRLPELFTLGPLDAAARSGPGIWLRCVLAGKIAGVGWPPARTSGAVNSRCGCVRSSRISSSQSRSVTLAPPGCCNNWFSARNRVNSSRCQVS